MEEKRAQWALDPGLTHFIAIFIFPPCNIDLLRP